MSNFALYIFGMLVVIAGLAWAATRFGVSGTWIVIGAIVLLGIGVVSGVTRTRQRETPPPPQ
jgi:hypothetical protein